MRGSLPAPAPCPSIGFSFSIDYRYDAVVWNFPYPIEWSKHNIEVKCQELLYKFFVSAKKMIDDEGQIRIALIRGQYERWYIKHFAGLAGLGLEQMIPFKKEDHKYYLNRYCLLRSRLMRAVAIDVRKYSVALAARHLQTTNILCSRGAALSTRWLP